MILKETFDKSRIVGFRNKYRNADPGMLDKMIHALALLEMLTSSGLDFIFKGGTSLVLLLDETNRFSTDIDIITEADQSVVEEHLNKITSSGFFTKWEIDKKRSFNSKIPKAHYDVFYLSDVAQKETTVLLDVLYCKNPYPSLESRTITSEWLITGEPLFSTKIPSIECILGDKLTAFAPTTTGIPYGRNKDVEMIKQLFDISLLIDRSRDYELVKQSFLSTAEKELSYRENAFGVEAIYEDVFHTALVLAKREKNKPGPDLEGFAEMQQGIKKIDHFAANKKFRIEEAIAAAAKDAYLLQLFSTGSLSRFSLYSDKVEMNDWSVTNTEYNFLNRFSKTNRPAFFYWYSLLKSRNEL